MVWPIEFQQLGWNSPSLFYFENNDDAALPKGYTNLQNASIGVPKKSRKNYPHTIRVDAQDAGGDEGGGGGHDASHGKYVLAAEDESKKDEWLEVLVAGTEGKARKAKLVLFGASLDGLVQAERKRCVRACVRACLRTETTLCAVVAWGCWLGNPVSRQQLQLRYPRSSLLTRVVCTICLLCRYPTCSCRVPLLFIDLMQRMAELQCFTVEGLFRVPGDHNDMTGVCSPSCTCCRVAATGMPCPATRHSPNRLSLTHHRQI
eukprot:SAG22_NODE_1348_length_4662_cov_2.722113_5_plen_261_part_00